MRRLRNINEVIEENAEDINLTKRCTEHFFRHIMINMENEIDIVRVPYLGRLINTLDAKNKKEQKGSKRRNYNKWI